MTPVEKIDRVLDFLKKKSDLSASFGKEYIWNLFIERTPELNINSQLYEEIFKKLVEDGYIRENNSSTQQPTYHLTLKGLTFDGYQNEQLAIHNLKQLAIETNKSTVKTNKFLRINGSLIFGVSIISLILSGIVLYMSQASNTTTEKTFNLNKETLELQKKEFEHNRIKDSLLLNIPDTIVRLK